MQVGRKMAPSREGKKQVIAYLHPTQAEAAYSKAARDDKTNQEIIGEALNSVFAFYGMPPPVPAGHRRVIRRTSARALVRDEVRGPRCRAGRVGYAGWFPEEVVKKVHTMSSEHGVSVQDIIEHGLKLITGVDAPRNEEDEDGAGHVETSEAA